jgi:hypothetical protein
MKYTKPPVTTSAVIRDMAPETVLFLPKPKPSVVQATVARVRKQLRDRKYRTQKVNGGTKIWRDA